MNFLSLDIHSKRILALMIVSMEILLGLIITIFPARSILLMMVGLPLFFLVVLDHKWGLFLLAFTIPFVGDEETTIRFVELFAIGRFSVRISDVIFLALFVSWLYSFAVDSNKRLGHDPLRGPIILILLWMLLSLFWAPDQTAGVILFVKILQGFLVYTLVLSLLEDEKTFRLLLYAWVLSGVVLATAGTLEAHFSSTSTLQSIEAGAGIGKFRPTGIQGNPKQFGLTLDACIIIAFYLFTQSSRRVIKLLYAVAISILFVGVLSSYSRTPVVALIITMTFLLYYVGKLNPTRIIVLLSVTVIISFLLSQGPIWEAFSYRMQRRMLTTNIDTMMGGRISIWKHCLNIFKEHPILGVGIGNSRIFLQNVETNIPTFPYPHNFFLFTLVELGAIGFFLFINFLIRVITAIVRCLRQLNDLHKRTLIVFLSSGLFMFFISVQVTTYRFQKKTVWVFLAMTMAALNLLSKQQGKNHG
jgi:O-antigen ligase